MCLCLENIFLLPVSSSIKLNNSLFATRTLAWLTSNKQSQVCTYKNSVPNFVIQSLAKLKYCKYLFIFFITRDYQIEKMRRIMDIQKITSPLFPLTFPIIDSGAWSEIASCKAGANYIEVLSDYKFVAAISCLWLAHAFERLLGDASPKFNRLHFETTSEIDPRQIFLRRVRHSRSPRLDNPPQNPEILCQSSRDTLHASLHPCQRDPVARSTRET